MISRSPYKPRFSLVETIYVACAVLMLVGFMVDATFSSPKTSQSAMMMAKLQAQQAMLAQDGVFTQVDPEFTR
jgi:hypothetical protein